MSSSRMQTYVPIIRKFVARVMLLHSSVAARLGVNLTDVNSLRLLGGEAMSAGKLSEQLGLTGAATTALIDRLELAGFVTRERSSNDRRRVTVHADASKLRQVNDLYAGQGVRMANLLAKYSDEEFQVIMDFLEQSSVALAEEAKALREQA
jgi:DNA-binding MarR family transcriptional regulator